MLHLLRLLLMLFLPLWTVLTGLSIGLGMLRTGDVIVAAVMSSQRGDYRLETLDVESGFRMTYHPGRLLAGVLFSPDSRYALMVALQPYNPVEVLDMYTGALYQTPMDLQVSGASWMGDNVLLTAYDPTQFYFGVYTIDVDGEETHHVLDVQDEVWTDWLPAGERFAFSRQDRLYTVHLDGRDSQTLTTGANPVASPDGRYLAFSRDGRLHLVGVDATDESISLMPGSFDPTWSPDSRKIAYVVVEPDGQAAYITDIASGHNARIQVETLELIRDLRWSPDGTQLAFVSTDRRQSVLYITDYITDATGTNPRRVVEDGHDPVWSPEGTRLLFRTQERDRLYLVDLTEDNAEPRHIANSAEDQIWSPDGEQIAFRHPITPGAPSDLQIVTLDSGRARRIFGMGSSVQSFIYRP